MEQRVHRWLRNSRFWMIDEENHSHAPARFIEHVTPHGFYSIQQSGFDMGLTRGSTAVQPLLHGPIHRRDRQGGNELGHDRALECRQQKRSQVTGTDALVA